MSKQILVEIKVAGSDELVRSRQAIVGLQKDIKDLEGIDQRAAEQKKIALKSEQDNYRQLQKEAKAEAEAIKGATDTLAKKRAELARMNKELDNTKIGSESFKKLTAESKKLRAEINGVDQEAGKFNGNVGNYKGAIIDAFSAMGINVGALTGNISKANSAIQLTNVSIGGTSKALNVLKLALISTGIGAIVVVLGSIVAYLVSTQEGMDKINKILIPLGNVFQRVLGIVQKLGKALFDIFTGNFKEGFAEFSNTVSNIGNDFREAWQQGERLANISKQIGEAKIKLAENEGRIKREIAEQRALLEDINLSEAKKAEAGRKAIALNRELLALQSDVSKLEYEQLRIKSEQNDGDREAQAELAKKKEEVNALTATALMDERDIKKRINLIDKKAADDRIKQIQIERALQQLQYEELVSSIENILELQEKANNGAETKIFKLQEEGEIVDQTDRVLELFEESAQKGLAIAQYFNQQKKDVYAEDLNNLKDALAKGLISEEEYESARFQVKKKYAEQILNETANMLNGLSEIFGKESKAGKAAAIVATTINTYLAAMEAYKNGVKYGGPIGIPLGVAMAAVATAFGLKQIASIQSTKDSPRPKFARGVIGLNGPGTGTSDSIDAKLSRGESVMTARATAAFAPMLARMEEAVGNRPNYQLGQRRFAGGIIGVPNADIMGGTERIIRQTIEAIGSIPVVVAEGDITSTQNRVAQIKTQGDL